MWAHRHYTLFSGTVDILWVLQTEERPAKAARSFDNWELYKFQNPPVRILELSFFPSFSPYCVFLKSCVWWPHCEGDKSFDINHCVKVKGIQSSAQEEEPLIACFAPALPSSVLQIKQQLLHAAEQLSMCARFSRTCVCESLFTCAVVCVHLCLIVKISLCQEPQMHISSVAGREELEFLLISDGQTQGSLHLKHHCFCQGPRVQSRRAEQLWSAVLCFFFFHTESHWGTWVCVWDAGMHGANPPLSSNAWTVSKTLLLLLLPSMLIRRGLGWGVCVRCVCFCEGVGVHRCNSRLTSQHS